MLRPPQEIREAAEGLGFDRLLPEARGYDALGFRVKRAHVGLEVLVLGPDGRIVSDYQFIEG